MIANAELRDRDPARHEDHFVHLDGVTWAHHERLLEIRGDRSARRITLLEDTSSPRLCRAKAPHFGTSRE
jgi:hypothetical protein